MTDEQPRPHRPVDEGGDPACWLGQVCPECGAFIEQPAAASCPRCGEPLPTDDSTVGLR